MPARGTIALRCCKFIRYPKQDRELHFNPSGQGGLGGEGSARHEVCRALTDLELSNSYS